MSNPFDFLKRLPDAQITGDFEQSPGIKINGAFCEKSNVLVNVMHGPKVPQITWTLSVAGRGALVMGEQEFRDLLSAGLALFEVRSPGFSAPEPTSPQKA